MKKVLCDACGTVFKEELIKDAKVCPVCGEQFDSDEDVEKDWITWRYYRDPEYGDYSLWDKTPNDPNVLQLVQEFKAPPEDFAGGLDAVKDILRTYIPDAFAPASNQTPVIRCPRCNSSEYTLLNKGYSLFTGFLGSGRIKRVCNRCKKEF